LSKFGLGMISDSIKLNHHCEEAYACVGTDRSCGISCQTAVSDRILYYRIAEHCRCVSGIEIGRVGEIDISAAKEGLVSGCESVTVP
jgi:hypothetical protein